MCRTTTKYCIKKHKRFYRSIKKDRTNGNKKKKPSFRNSKISGGNLWEWPSPHVPHTPSIEGICFDPSFDCSLPGYLFIWKIVIGAYDMFVQSSRKDFSQQFCFFLLMNFRSTHCSCSWWSSPEIPNMFLQQIFQTRVHKIPNSIIFMFLLCKVVFHIRIISRYSFLHIFMREGSQLLNSDYGNILNINMGTSLLVSSLLFFSS